MHPLPDLSASISSCLRMTLCERSRTLASTSFCSLVRASNNQLPVQGQRLTEAIASVDRLRASTWTQHELRVGIPATTAAEHAVQPQECRLQVVHQGRSSSAQPRLGLHHNGQQTLLESRVCRHGAHDQVLVQWLHDRPGQREWLEAEWRLAQQRLHIDGNSHYLFHHLWQALASLNWHPTQLTSWRTNEGRAIDLVHTTPGAFMHEVRRNIQQHAAHEVQATRLDFGGLACLARVTVMKALAGLAPTDRNAIRHGRSTSCPFCGHPAPNQEHQLWRCSVQSTPSPSLHAVAVLNHPHQPECFLQRGIIFDTFPWQAFNMRSQKQRQAWAIGFYQQLAMRRRNRLDKIAAHREAHLKHDGEAPVRPKRTRTARLRAQHAQYLSDAAASASASGHAWERIDNQTRAITWQCRAVDALP
eukprot:6319576-Amphidinium_carterae.2